MLSYAILTNTSRININITIMSETSLN